MHCSNINKSRRGDFFGSPGMYTGLSAIFLPAQAEGANGSADFNDLAGRALLGIVVHLRKGAPKTLCCLATSKNLFHFFCTHMHRTGLSAVF